MRRLDVAAVGCEADDWDMCRLRLKITSVPAASPLSGAGVSKCQPHPVTELIQSQGGSSAPKYWKCHLARTRCQLNCSFNK